MGVCCSNKRQYSPEFEYPRSDSTAIRQKSKAMHMNQDYNFIHTKHYERYFNRQFKVSVCTAKGERKTMEDDHLCQFIFSKHPHYSLFGIFDGHNGSEASEFVADHLYRTLNDLPDLQNNQSIIEAIKQMDKHFLKNTQSDAGSTIIFAITFHDIDLRNAIQKRMEITSEMGTDHSDQEHVQNDVFDEHDAEKQLLNLRKSEPGNALLPGFEFVHSARLFWCGDSRAFLVKSSEDDSFEQLTVDHNTKNKDEVNRVKAMGGKIMKNRVDGLLSVTRAFGDRRVKYDGSAVICECEFNDFTANKGDSLLLCCDGIVEKWSNKTLINKLKFNLDGRDTNADDMDTAKAMGDLVDDAIIEGSHDNITVMLIQFKDGRKQKTNKKYDNI